MGLRLQGTLRVLAVVVLVLAMIQGAVSFQALRSLNTGLAAMEAGLRSAVAASPEAAPYATSGPSVFGTFTSGWEYLALFGWLIAGAIVAALLWAAAQALDALTSLDISLVHLARLGLAARSAPTDILGGGQP